MHIQRWRGGGGRGLGVRRGAQTPCCRVVSSAAGTASAPRRSGGSSPGPCSVPLPPTCAASWHPLLLQVEPQDGVAAAWGGGGEQGNMCGRVSRRVAAKAGGGTQQHAALALPPTSCLRPPLPPTRASDEHVPPVLCVQVEQGAATQHAAVQLKRACQEGGGGARGGTRGGLCVRVCVTPCGTKACLRATGCITPAPAWQLPACSSPAPPVVPHLPPPASQLTRQPCLLI